jgi:nucleoside-diphosphate-sugar epimerase
MENIAFVTGSTGRIGNELTSILIKNKFTVVCVGRFQKNSTLDVKFLQNENKSLKFSEEIIYDKWIEISENELNNIITFAKNLEVMSYFFHLAWEGGNTLTDGGFEIQNNNIGVSSMYFDLSKKLKVKKFINAGSFDELYVKRILDSKKYSEAVGFSHFDYGFSKLATKDIISFKAYVEKIDFIHTLTSVTVDKQLKNNNFVENNLKKILAGDDYEIPNNPELCNISTLSNVANELYTIALYGSNQKTYYTGNDLILSLETYFKLLHEIINNKKIILDKKKVDEANLLNCEVLNNFERFGEIDKSNVETKLKNLVGSLKVK